MRWDAVIPGQPPSLNHSYVNRVRQVQRRGAPVFKTDGEPAMQRYRALTDDALAYRNGAQMIFQSRRPSAFRPAGQIRVCLDFALAKGKGPDADNAQKILLDALKLAIDHDDEYFLTCVRTRETGHDQPFVLVTIDDDPSHP